MEQECLNCGSEVSDAYCSQCGQRKLLPGIRMRDVISDFLSYSFSIDGPVWRTLALLLTNPGHLFRSFIGGKRKAYYKPIQFFVLSTLLYFAFAELIEFDPLKGQFDGASPEKAEPYMKKVEQASQFMVKNINNFLFLQVFVIAAVLKLFHWKRFTFAAYLAIGFYISGFYILIGMVDLIASLGGLSAGRFKLILFPVYFTYAYVSLRGKFSWSALVTGILASVLIYIIYMVLSFGFSYAWISI
ncbi:MAG: DUF3667 domain-containing protein [Cryomorphaceae bacterium]